jgi:UPF0716 protein FxsA
MRRSERQTASRLRLAPFLLLAFIAVPLAEIAVLIEVGGRIGVGLTLALIILTAVLGTWMLRHQGFSVLTRAQRQLEQGVMPVAEVFEGLCLLVAGVLLLTPGFLTDAVGALLLVPQVRALLYRQVADYLERHVVSQASSPREREPPILDAEFEEIDPDEAPPPRGGWGRDR